MIEKLREVARQLDTILPITIFGTRKELLKIGVPIESLSSKQWFEFQIAEVQENNALLKSDCVYLMPNPIDEIILYKTLKKEGENEIRNCFK